MRVAAQRDSAPQGIILKMKNYEINFKQEKIEWDRFIDHSPQRSIFAYSKFLDSLQVEYDLVTCNENNSIVAGAIIILSDNQPITAPFPFTQYQGMMLSENKLQSVGSQITRNLRIVEYFLGELIGKYKSFFLSNSWRLNDLRSFQWYGYSDESKSKFNIDLRYTGILELQKFKSFDDYIGSVRTVRRQAFKKGEKFLSFKFEADESILDYLHEKTFQRQGLKRGAADSEILKSICRSSIDQGYGKMGVTYLNGLPISAALFLVDDRSAYYLIGANDPEFRQTESGTYTLINMIKESFNIGVSEVDFVGVNSPQRGDFKIGFNAELKPYFNTFIN